MRREEDMSVFPPYEETPLSGGTESLRPRTEVPPVWFPPHGYDLGPNLRPSWVANLRCRKPILPARRHDKDFLGWAVEEHSEWPEIRKHAERDVHRLAPHLELSRSEAKLIKFIIRRSRRVEPFAYLPVYGVEHWAENELDVSKSQLEKLLNSLRRKGYLTALNQPSRALKRRKPHSTKLYVLTPFLFWALGECEAEIALKFTDE